MLRPNPVSRRSNKSEYIETETGNKIARRSRIEGKQNIMLAGRSVVMTGATLRGDLHRKADKPAQGEKETITTAITIGRASVISTNCTLRPPMKMKGGQMDFQNMRIGDNVFVGTGTHVSSLSISSHVHIGEDCVLSPFSVIKDNCQILPRTVVPPHMVIPPGSVVAGRPARIIGEVGEGWGQGGGGEGEEYVVGGDLRPLVRSIK